MKKILIIEDEKMLGEMYQEKFRKEGFEAFLAGSTEEAIEAVPKIKPDLILLDILLPKKNGIGFMEWFSGQKEFASVPVIAFSNYDHPEKREKAKKLGIKDYLIKTDFTPQEIVDKVKKYLENT
ncbi:MAG: response regulator [Minisyncoccales bacterium]